MEIVPDSEEDRRHSEKKRGKGLFVSDIIEISSDEEDLDRDCGNKKGSCERLALNDPFMSRMPCAWPVSDTEKKKAANADGLPDQDWAPRTPRAPSKSRRTYRSRMIVYSSSSEDSDDDHQPQRDPDVIELSDSSPERSPGKASKELPIPACTNIPADEDSCSDDDGILILDEPRSARKPIRVNPGQVRSITAIIDPTSFSTPARPKLNLGTPRSERLPVKQKQAPRTGKKAQVAAERANRVAYAQVLFTELNHVVFGDGLPKDTKLNWNKRLLTTAGRAKWHRSREGVQTTEIELAEKILDCEERIRNTLSHEMCHLATWILNANPKEGHGKLWKGWANKVMRKRPEITISTRHNYEISHPFEWECAKCAKIYGRFSKSIRPDECVCGACKEGKLIPLFSDAKKTPKTPKTSRNASIKPQDSPCSLPRPQVVHQSGDEIDHARPAIRGSEQYPIYTVSDSESESDIRVLAAAMGSVTLTTLES